MFLKRPQATNSRVMKNFFCVGAILNRENISMLAFLLIEIIYWHKIVH